MTIVDNHVNDVMCFQERFRKMRDSHYLTCTTHPRCATICCNHTKYTLLAARYAIESKVWFHEGRGRYTYTVHQCPLSCGLGQSHAVLPHLLHNGQLDSLALGQTHPWLRPLSNLVHIWEPCGKLVASGILDVANVKAPLVLLPVLYNAHSPSVASTWQQSKSNAM